MPPKLLLSPLEIRRLRDDGKAIRVIDVRGSSAFRRSDERVADDIRLHGKGVAGALDGVAPETWLLTYCTCLNDGLAVLAAERLRQAGYPNAHGIQDGLEGCREAGLEVVAKSG